MESIRGHATQMVLLALAAVIAAALAGVTVNNLRTRADRSAEAAALTGGEPSRAPALLRRFGCAGCHEIPGIAGADGKVGGSLAGIRDRVFIAGVATNTSDNLVRWIVSPQTFSPRSAMPATGISSQEARDVAAYLYSQ